MMVKYPTKGKFDIYPSLESACADNAPSLAKIDAQYGKGTAVLWLTIQLIGVASFTGLNEKFRPNQLKECAQHIRQIGYHLTLAEMMIFFARFEQGYYQQFNGYERPNPQIITKSFQRFISELMETRLQVQREEEQDRARKEREEAKKNAVPPPPEIAARIERFYKDFGNIKK